MTDRNTLRTVTVTVATGDLELLHDPDSFSVSAEDTSLATGECHILQQNLADPIPAIISELTGGVQLLGGCVPFRAFLASSTSCHCHDLMFSYNGDSQPAPVRVGDDARPLVSVHPETLLPSAEDSASLAEHRLILDTIRSRPLRQSSAWSVEPCFGETSYIVTVRAPGSESYQYCFCAGQEEMAIRQATALACVQHPGLDFGDFECLSVVENELWRFIRLQSAARQVVQHWESGDLAAAVGGLSDALEATELP